MPFSPLDEGPSLLWRQLIYQDNCYERCKPSIDPLADTDRHHHHPIRSRFGLYRSLFNSSLSDKLGEPVSQVAFSFGLLSLGLALSSSVAGKLQERFGVKRVTMASGILLGLGFFLTAHSSSLMMLWLSAGVLVGLADGAGYLLTLSNCVKWFPERKGLISAFSIGSYGLGSLGFKFIDSHLLATVGLEKTFVIWGAIVLVMIVFGATLMKDAPNHPAATAANGVVENDFTLAESMRKPQYWMLAVMFLTACMSGLYVIGVAKDIAREWSTWMSPRRPTR